MGCNSGSVREAGRRPTSGTLRRGAAAVMVAALCSVACSHVGKPPWWPKAAPVAGYCSTPPHAAEARELVLVAELDFDDGHVKRTELVNPVNPRATPSTPELARIGDCYSRAVDLEPPAAGKVAVHYSRDAKTRAADVCLVQSSVKDGAFVSCVMEGVGTIPSEWFVTPNPDALVSIDFRPVTEQGSREWYATGEGRWDGNQMPRMRDVPLSD